MSKAIRRGGKDEMRSALSHSVSDFSTVLIVDDEKSILSLCCDLAVACGWKTQTASTTDEALNILRTIQIDCLITDIRVPTKGGMALIKTARSAFPMIRIFVLSQFGSIRTAVEAMRLGAMDFITKPFVIEDFQSVLRSCSRSKKKLNAPEQRGTKNNLLDVPGLGVALYDSRNRCMAINDVLAQKGLPPHVNFTTTEDERSGLDEVSAGPNANAKGRDSIRLTHREVETLKRIAQGNCNKEIADGLGLSPKTIDTYRQRIMSKLDLHTPSDLIRYAIRNGFVKS
jgi:FixJ family two-component response regulator